MAEAPAFLLAAKPLPEGPGLPNVRFMTKEAGPVRRVTLRQIADQAGVHVSTVSRALDPEVSALVRDSTRARVQEVAARLGYRPDVIASALRRGKTTTVGVVVADLANPFIAPLIAGIENGLERRGFMPLLAETQDDDHRLERVLAHFLQRRVDAIITTAARLRHRQLLADLAASLPVVAALRGIQAPGVALVLHDDVLGGRLAAQHLIALGHGRLAQLRGPQDISSFRDRTRGFAEAARRSGVVVLDAGESASRPVFEEGSRLMRRLLAHVDTPPLSVFAQNDMMAIGAIDVVTAAGLRCPEDVAVMGYNNSPMSGYLNPPLTTIQLPAHETGRLAAERAIALIEDPQNAPETVALPPTLVARASTLGRLGMARPTGEPLGEP